MSEDRRIGGEEEGEGPGSTSTLVLARSQNQQLVDARAPLLTGMPNDSWVCRGTYGMGEY